MFSTTMMMMMIMLTTASQRPIHDPFAVSKGAAARLSGISFEASAAVAPFHKWSPNDNCAFHAFSQIDGKWKLSLPIVSSSFSLFSGSNLICFVFRLINLCVRLTGEKCSCIEFLICFNLISELSFSFFFFCPNISLIYI